MVRGIHNQSRANNEQYDGCGDDTHMSPCLPGRTVSTGI